MPVLLLLVQRAMGCSHRLFRTVCKSITLSYNQLTRCTRGGRETPNRVKHDGFNRVSYKKKDAAVTRQGLGGMQSYCDSSAVVVLARKGIPMLALVVGFRAPHMTEEKTSPPVLQRE